MRVCADCTGGEKRGLGYFSSGQGLVFYLNDDTGGTCLSTDPNHARVAHPIRTRWTLSWDDVCDDSGGQDFDYNDLVVQIDLVVSPASFAVLSGANEVPGPGDPNGAGAAIIKANAVTKSLCATLSWTEVAIPVAAHIHQGAAGATGSAVIDISNALRSGTGCLTGVSASLIRAIKANPGNYYINVQTRPFPNGAIRPTAGLTGLSPGPATNGRTPTAAVWPGLPVSQVALRCRRPRCQPEPWS